MSLQAGYIHLPFSDGILEQAAQWKAMHHNKFLAMLIRRDGQELQPAIPQIRILISGVLHHEGTQ